MIALLSKEGTIRTALHSREGSEPKPLLKLARSILPSEMEVTRVKALRVAPSVYDDDFPLEKLDHARLLSFAKWQQAQISCTPSKPVRKLRACMVLRRGDRPSALRNVLSNRDAPASPRAPDAPDGTQEHEHTTVNSAEPVGSASLNHMNAARVSRDTVAQTKRLQQP
jgi:hypothetical protein